MQVTHRPLAVRVQLRRRRRGYQLGDIDFLAPLHTKRSPHLALLRAFGAPGGCGTRDDVGHLALAILAMIISGGESAFCEGKRARYKIPPRNAAGKVLKRVLRDGGS